MNNTLIEKLSRLKLEEKALKRGLDKNLSKEARTEIFNRLKEIKEMQNKVKFRLELERNMRK